MAPVTETRESGIEIVDIEPEFGEDVPEDALPDDVTVFRTEDEQTIVVSETAGHEVTVTAQYFVAAAVDREADEMTQALTGEEREEYAMVHISNENGYVGGAFIQEDGGDVEAAIESFEDEHL